jgi:hypothetical protein
MESAESEAVVQLSLRPLAKKEEKERPYRRDEAKAAVRTRR